MRCNPKYFDLGNSIEPVETQEFDGRKIEIYHMNDFENAFDQNLVQGRFAMWTSVDGTNYRLYIEEGFHKEMHQLYTEKVNGLWLNYWDRVDAFTRKINFKILMPVCILLIGLLILLTMVLKDNKVITILQITLAACFIVGMFVTSSFQKRKAQSFHNEAIESIKEAVGQNNFENLLKKQSEYMNAYLDNRAKEEEAKYRAEHPEDFEDEEPLHDGSLETELLDNQENTSEENVNLEIVEEIKEEEELDTKESNK